MMKHVWIFFLVCFHTVIENAKAVRVLKTYHPGYCDKNSHGEQVLVRNRKEKEIVLVCTESNGVYEWKPTDGSAAVGEYFNPGIDCTDILNKDAEAETGFYWISIGKPTPKKIWCDMTTDGGGFMLVGHNNASKWWNVPFDDTPVHPYGPAQWSSDFGDLSILDFRVQVSSGSYFNQTKSHWLYRFKNKRQLQKLLVQGEKDCPDDSPGIGDVAYVKDLLLDKVVTTNFRCSKFGTQRHPLSNTGWAKMNDCLQKPCLGGFAFLDTFPVQVDFSGTFSYSVESSYSGVGKDSTASVGCGDGKCCGCFGPVGGTNNYCSKDCTTLSGGTQRQDVSSWYWVRTNPPKKVWDQCMEYKTTNKNGKVEWYTLIGGRVDPVEGRCVQNQALLNDGIAVVPDTNVANMLPPIPGLLVYQKDTEELYLRTKNSLELITQESKLLQRLSQIIEAKFDEFEKKLNNTEQVIKLLAGKLLQVQTNLEQQLTSQNDKVEEKLSILNSSIERLKEQVKSVNQSQSSFRTDGFTFSHILRRGNNYATQLRKWVPQNSFAILCYRATEDGWTASNFHSRCDNRGATVTIVRVGDYVFGGYTDKSWGGSQRYIESTEAFLFSLKSKDDTLRPFKSPILSSKSKEAMFNAPSFGPIFGSGNDLLIATDANMQEHSFTNFGNSYELPSGYAMGNIATQSLLAGGVYFKVSEIEVYYFGAN